MTERYDPKEFEAKWAERWEADQLYRTAPADQRPKAYILDFFPYPSGDGLSVGHCRNYVPTDVLSRYYRMRGYNVLHPMGWDAFGLPAENAAIERKTNPAKLIAQFSANYQRQFRLIGISFDWSREINSSTPEYYRWTQWIFLQLYNSWYDPRQNAARPIAALEAELAEKGTAGIGSAPPMTAEQWKSLSARQRKDYLSNFRLAYRAASTVNWDPVEKTVLANEEVIDGKGWRSGALVEKKTLMQWFFRITAYADRLLSDLQGLDWPENIKLMQINWIGRSEGAEVIFDTPAGGLHIFTTRPDTLWGATFMVLSPEHPFVSQLTSPEQRSEVEAYVAEARTKSDIDRTAVGKEKTGVFTGASAANPVNGEKIPIWVADYVLMGYGTGAIMAVPAHDQRDFEFARKFDLPIRVVIQPDRQVLTAETMSEAWPGEGRMVNSGSFDGTGTDVSAAKVTEWLAASGKGKRRINYKLRDWGISRQRYWGTPIPIVHTADGEEPAELPVTLPDVQHYEPTDTGESPLAAISEFVNTPKGKRETDTMGTFACSAWYYLRFADPHNSQAAFDKEQVAYWLPVDMYVGGAEHAVMHLLYARFWTKALHDLGYVPFVEPFKRLRNQGMILAPDGKEKMSKSKGNVITPDETVAEWGADALRAYEMFISDFEMATPWNTHGLAGTHRWLRRAWEVLLNSAPRPTVDASTEQVDRDLRRWTHKTLRKVSQDIEGFRFNTVISSLMEFTNTLFDAQRQPVSDAAFNEATGALLLMVAPVAPFMAEEIWAHKGRPYSIHQQAWPQFDAALAAEESITLVLQVNGKVRGRITMPVGLTEAQARATALENEAVRRHLDGKTPRKVIYVAGKLVNVVV
jgi:leucyl-tRNA synthetase